LTLDATANVFHFAFYLIFVHDCSSMELWLGLYEATVRAVIQRRQSHFFVSVGGFGFPAEDKINRATLDGPPRAAVPAFCPFA